eukprot:2602895-Rhodomonas_salina.1
MRCPGPDITAIRKYVQAPDALELAETAQVYFPPFTLTVTWGGVATGTELTFRVNGTEGE